MSEVLGDSIEVVEPMNLEDLYSYFSSGFASHEIVAATA
jgi:hypothetical protein